ncbi:hypothetical protein HY404_02785 [Candidatus Microgenomates bacterium]|nr:hypothetical protein [Candidatus Microgenomates bacterium]
MTRLIIVLSLIFWPLSLFLANTVGDFVKYFFPVLLLILSWQLFKKNNSLFLWPTLLIPFFEPKLAVLPLLLGVMNLKRHWLFIGATAIVLAFNFKAFWGQTIFKADYEAQQEIIGKSYLYPNVPLARLFQNKGRIYVNKFTANFLALSDPNNYFFGFHPREIKVDNQNLRKFPFLGIMFMLLGFYYLAQLPQKKFVMVLLTASFISLTVLNIFDRHDVILWLPLSILYIHGVKEFSTKKWWWHRLNRGFYVVFIIFTVWELIRLFL